MKGLRWQCGCGKEKAEKPASQAHAALQPLTPASFVETSTSVRSCASLVNIVILSAPNFTLPRVENHDLNPYDNHSVDIEFEDDIDFDSSENSKTVNYSKEGGGQGIKMEVDKDLKDYARHALGHKISEDRIIEIVNILTEKGIEYVSDLKDRVLNRIQLITLIPEAQVNKLYNTWQDEQEEQVITPAPAATRFLQRERADIAFQVNFEEIGMKERLTSPTKLEDSIYTTFKKIGDRVLSTCDTLVTRIGAHRYYKTGGKNTSKRKSADAYGCVDPAPRAPDGYTAEQLLRLIRDTCKLNSSSQATNHYLVETTSEKFASEFDNFERVSYGETSTEAHGSSTATFEQPNPNYKISVTGNIRGITPIVDKTKTQKRKMYDSPYILPPNEQRKRLSEAINSTLVTFNKSPFNLRRAARSSYLHRKCTQIKNVCKDTFRRKIKHPKRRVVPDQATNYCESPSSSSSSESTDHKDSKMLSALSSKFKNMEKRSEKLQILTVAVTSESTKQLVEQKRILSTTNPRPGRTLPEETAKLVVDFYETDDVSSKLLTGTRDNKWKTKTTSFTQPW
ncbi:hypothetical protein B566_EDAN014869 [Ephemera danica]|nr:hypothetical protein B566_EDAN014869 [Ephemera danica]